MYLIDFKSLFMNPMDLLWYARFGMRVQFHNDHVEHYIEDDFFSVDTILLRYRMWRHRAMRSDFSVSFQFLFSFFSVRDDNIFSP